MAAILKRLSLGLLLIAATSTLLLLSDLGSRARPASATDSPPAAKGRKVRVALMQHASQTVLDQGREGMFAGLADRGWVKGENLEVKFYNAEGDMPVAQTIAKEMVGGGYDLLLTISTVSMQAVANANKAGKTPHIFGLVSDPYGAGVGINRENHLDHPPHLAGYGTMQPIALAFKTARELNPSLARVGTVWNAAESNSEAQVKLARSVCAEMGIALSESTVDNSAGVAEAASALVARGVEAIWLGGDVTVLSAVDAVIAVARKGNIPVFTVIPPNVKHGALFDVGADYAEVGRLAGQLAGDVLNGRSPATVPIENVMPETLTVNRHALNGLKARWTIPESVVRRARLVIDENGVELRPASKQGASNTASAASPAIAAPVSGRTYRIAFGAFAPEPGLEACQRGLLEGLREFGFIEGENLAVARSHAQGEMLNIPPMIQNLDHTDADVLVTFSTPVLQSALTMAKRKPVVFTYVTDPLAAGAGKTFDDHMPHVTGIGSLPPIDDTIRILRRALPKVTKLGTLYNSGEANSVKIIGMLREATRRAGITLVELTAATSGEVVQVTQGLVARGVEAIYIPSDNTAYLAYDGILKIARNARLPVIIDDPDSVERGALFCCGPGYYHSGKAAAPALARVLHGEKPATIPFENVSVNVTRFNQEAIKRLELPITAELVRELETPAPAAASARAATAAKLPAKKWKIAVVLYNETPPAEEVLDGMKDAWARSHLVAGRDYEIKIRSAQGDMSALSGILEAAQTDGADMIVPLSTPTLQVAAQRVKNLPIVFSMVANPMAAGAGKSYTDHPPNITGIAVLAPFAEVLDTIQKHFPSYKRLGTVFCPAEANSVDLKEALEVLCKKRGFTLDAVAANTATDLPDAALSLVSRRIDVVLQISDNLSSAGFTAIARAARQARKPLLSLNSTTVPLGAPFAFGRDYHNAGEATVAMIERIIGGESPARMPFELPPKIVSTASRSNAAAVGMTLPPALLSSASKVVD